ncbi:MAG: hypothetical protein OXJ37_08655 [Bryobacterales bacterium]|nr:hypothetical protein [Bryobacterales bacterium]
MGLLTMFVVGLAEGSFDGLREFFSRFLAISPLNPNRPLASVQQDAPPGATNPKRGGFREINLQPHQPFQARERPWDVAKALCGSDKTQHEPWAEARCDDLEQGRIDSLLATLRAHADRCEEAAKCADYIDKNRSRMRYPEFRQPGLCVGCGVVEAGCRTAVGRLKRSGMYWTVDNANAILALRCRVLSGNYEDFWADRAENPCVQPAIQTLCPAPPASRAGPRPKSSGSPCGKPLRARSRLVGCLSLPTSANTRPSPVMSQAVSPGMSGASARTFVPGGRRSRAWCRTCPRGSPCGR